MATAREFEERGIQAAKGGRKDEARKLLQQALKLDPNSDSAWVWLASVARDKRERLACLQKALEANPQNDTALKAVRAMGIDPGRLIRAPETPVEAAPEPEVFDDLHVPVPEADKLRALREQAEQLIQPALQPAPSTFEWTRKTRGRLGEGEVNILRAQVGVMLIVFLIGVGILLAFIYNQSPALQVAFEGASPTPVPPTFTPTNTPTNTPGFTPTPSPTRDFTNEPTFTPSPTIPFTITPGQIEITPRATDLNLPEEPGQAILISDALLNEGNPRDALPLLATARAQLGQTFDPNPFYYEALALAEVGQFEAALTLLAEAEGRITNFQGVRIEDEAAYSSLINLGFARVYFRQAQQAPTRTDREAALTLAEERAAAARASDQDLLPAYLVQADIADARGNYQAALEILTELNTFPQFTTDLNRIVAIGRSYLDQGLTLFAAGETEAARQAVSEALYQAFYALYINPYSEAAHRLQVEAALASNDPGLGVIYSQGYLLYYPNSAEAFRLLGDSRTAEGNTDLAFDAYNLALANGGSDSTIAEVLVSRARLYNLQRRYDLAQQDLTASLELRDDLNTRALRMRTAYENGDFATAANDASLVLGTGVLSDEEVQLIQALIRVDEADSPEAYSEALTLLNDVTNNIPLNQQPIADEYLARAHLGLGNLGDALNAVNRALVAGETGSRRFLRAQIFEARDERAEALADYEWVLTWDAIYDYPFAEEAQARINAIEARTAEENAQATATIITATAAVQQATATAGAPLTATANTFATATATAAVPITETADAQATADTRTMQANATASEEAQVATFVLETATARALTPPVTLTPTISPT